MKTIFITIVGLALLSCFAMADQQGTVVVNQTELPLNISVWQVFDGFDGLQVNFTFDSWMSGPESLYFEQNNTRNESFQIGIPENTPLGVYEQGFYAHSEWIEVNETEIIDEETNETTIVQVNTTMTDLTRYYWLVNVSLDETAEYAEINETQRTYTLCDYTIPLNRSAEFSIHGDPNMQVVTVCESDLLTCPEYVQLDGSGNGVANIGITLYDNLTAGEYTARVKIDLGLPDYLYYTYVFDIEDCVNLPPVNDAVLRYCSNLNRNSTAGEVILCSNAMDEYNHLLHLSLLDAAESRTINNTVVEYVDNNTVEYVPVAELDDETRDFFNNIGNLRTSWLELSSNSQILNQRLTQLEATMSDVINQNNALNANMKQEVLKTTENLSSELVTAQKELSGYRRGSVKYTTLLLIVLSVALIGGGGLLYVRWRRRTPFGA